MWVVQWGVLIVGVSLAYCRHSMYSGYQYEQEDSYFEDETDYQDYDEDHMKTVTVPSPNDMFDALPRLRRYGALPSRTRDPTRVQRIKEAIKDILDGRNIDFTARTWQMISEDATAGNSTDIYDYILKLQAARARGNEVEVPGEWSTGTNMPTRTPDKKRTTTATLYAPLSKYVEDDYVDYFRKMSDTNMKFKQHLRSNDTTTISKTTITTTSTTTTTSPTTKTTPTTTKTLTTTTTTPTTTATPTATTAPSVTTTGTVITTTDGAKSNMTTMSPNSTTKRTTRTTTTRRTTGRLDIDALVEIIANLTYDYDMDLVKSFNETLYNMSVPTCPTPTTTDTPTTTPTPLPFIEANATVIAKCFVCGLDSLEIPGNAFCADAFAGDFIPLVPVDPSAKAQIARFRKYCRYLDVNHYYADDREPRSIYGRWTGGCSVRWTDLSGVYTQRTCRNRHHATTGRHFASKRMAKLEMTLSHVDNGCIISPMATLLPLSRGISLFARFHACVCTGNWCNRGHPNQQWTPRHVILTLILLSQIST